MTERVLIDRDRLMNADRGLVASTAVRLYNAIQDFRKERQLLGLACAFVLLCDACNIPAQDVFTAAKNLMANPLKAEAYARPMAPQFEGLAFHLRTDVLTKD